MWGSRPSVLCNAVGPEPSTPSAASRQYFGSVHLGLRHLMRAIPDADIAATRSFYETRVGGAGPSSWAELREVRAARRVDPTVPGRTIEDIVESDVGGVPVRIILPRNGVVNGVHLHLHGGGFYMDCAARDDARSARRADALGVAVIGWTIVSRRNLRGPRPRMTARPWPDG